MKTPVKSIAIGVVRDAADIIAFSVLHSILLGVDRCIVIDNGSTDGTLELLNAIAKKLPQLSVISDCGPYNQAKMTETVMNEYTRAARTLVIPFDCDEFWDVSVPRLTAHFRRGAANIIACKVLNFVQSRQVTNPSRLSWMRAIRRAQAIAGDARTLVRDHTISFVEGEYPRKVLFQAEGQIALVRGAHSVNFADSRAELCNEFFCLHLPLRSRQELCKRAYDHELRIAASRKRDVEAWQTAYFREMLDRNMLNTEWAANSVDRLGRIDVYGVQRRMPYDPRLLLRLMRAYAYGLYLNILMQPS